MPSVTPMHAIVSDTGRWIGIVHLGEARILGRTREEPSLVEWARIVGEEWANLEEGALVRMLKRAADTWGGVEVFTDPPVVKLEAGNVIVLGRLAGGES